MPTRTGIIDFKTAKGVLHLGKCEIVFPAPLPHPAPVQTVEVEITITTTYKEFEEAIKQMIEEAMSESQSRDSDGEARDAAGTDV